MLYTSPVHDPLAKDPAVVRFGGRYLMYYTQRCEQRYTIGMAQSDDLENWQYLGDYPLDMPYEANGACAPGAIVLDGQVHLFYQTYGNGKNDAICHAVSADGLTFVRNPENPVFAPPATWCCGRAIDADVCVFGSRLHLYFATRDHAFEIQKVGGAWAALDSGFGKGAWTMLAEQSLLAPELTWEGKCIEAPATIVHDDKVYMFYGGSYNCCPQQIGCAVSDDGVFFRRLWTEPFLANGEHGAWNASESGHPFVFQDENGRVHLFYQGSPDGGAHWYLSRREILFENGLPRLV